MKVFRATTMRVFSLAACLIANQFAFGQVVINELVEDEQDFESTDVNPDTREFVELYNAGAVPVDISGWTIGTVLLASGAPFATDTIPGGSIIPAGGYFVIGQAAVPNVNFTPVAGELFPHANTIFELRNPALTGSTLVDAVGVDTFRGTELLTATQEQVDQIAAGQTAGATATGGWWGQLESNNAIAPNVPLSLGRYLNGRDTNRNGYDFGLQPLTPGASNNLPQNPSHTVPNVDAVAVGTQLSTQYGSSFVLPRVIDPTVASGFNPNAIPVSPQGGRAIIAYDETGGGDASYSKELVNKFDIYAYIDPQPFNNTTADSTQSEASVYGIGTTDPFFGTPNSAGLLTGQPGTGGNITSSANGSTGLGWLIQRRTSNTAGTQSSAAVLQLLDMNDGGDGVIADNDWQIKQSFDMTGMAAGWHRLAIEYNPATGAVTAMYDGQTFNFSTTTGLVGNFYVGYREQLPGAGNGPARPPTYDLFVPVGVAGDYNNNGIVDAADYVLWRNGGPLQNDPTAGVQPGDYDVWKANFGKTPGSGSSLGAVPEPASLLLVALGVLLAGIGRRRHGAAS